MKTTKLSIALVLAMLLSLGTTLAQDKSAKAYEKLKKEVEGISKDAAKYSASLKSTAQTLSKVSSADAKNVQKSIQSFRKDVEKLNKDLKSVTDGIKNLREKRTQYFAEWERSVESITNPELKKASADRREKVMADHAEMTEKATALREKIDVYMKELGEVVSFLGSDPTGGAVISAKPTLDKAIADGNSLAQNVQEVANRLATFAKGTY